MIRHWIKLLLVGLLLGGCMAEQTREISWVERPRLGVRLKVVEPVRSAGESSVQTARSLLVVRVYPGLPAQNAGIMPGDTLLRLDGTAVYGMGDSTAIMDSKLPGDMLLVTLERAGERLDIPVQLDNGNTAESAGETNL